MPSFLRFGDELKYKYNNVEYMKIECNEVMSGGIGTLSVQMI